MGATGGVRAEPVVRADLHAAHERAWSRLGGAGTWLTADERLAAVSQARSARDCALCATRKAALSPYGPHGEHAAAGPLSATDVDVVHRIATDPGRLTAAWFGKLGIAAERYVELLSVCAHTVALETFHHAVGLPARDLPPNKGGEPTRRLPEGKLDTTTAWVPLQRIRGVQNIMRAISLVPDELSAMHDVTAFEYLPLDRVTDLAFDPQRAIARPQMEHVAGRLSSRNNCFY